MTTILILRYMYRLPNLINFNLLRSATWGQAADMSSPNFGNFFVPSASSHKESLQWCTLSMVHCPANRFLYFEGTLGGALKAAQVLLRIPRGQSILSPEYECPVRKDLADGTSTQYQQTTARSVFSTKLMWLMVHPPEYLQMTKSLLHSNVPWSVCAIVKFSCGRDKKSCQNLVKTYQYPKL